MYKYLAIALNKADDSVEQMYLYKNTKTNIIYITQMYPYSAKFTGDILIDDMLYSTIYEPQIVSENDITQGYTKYWNQEWIIKYM